VNGSLHDGNYSVVVSNDFGSVTSAITPLQVDGTPSAHTVASIGMEMIFCPPGTFTMGSPTSETGRGTDETQHQVTLTNGFYLGKYEVTQAQYQTVMNGNSEGLNADPSQFKGSNRPVEKASWQDAQIFLSRLNSIEQSAGRLPNGWKYVLPTEAEWEYACRAGTTTMYSWGNDINSSRANYNWDGGANDGNDSKQTVNIGQFSANPWGFFDMHGNVWEWVSDWKTNYFTVAQTDPEGPASGSDRVLRGGSWSHGGTVLRSARRYYNSPSYRDIGIGFRVSFQAVQPDAANPELELFGGAGITREAGQAWAEPGAAGHDARDGNLTASVTVTGTVDMNTTGTYILTYSVADAAGNEVNASRTVTVVDTTNPVLTLLGDANMSQAKDSAWVDPGATASDSLDGNLTSSITITGTVDVNTTGVYTLTYSVSDGASNEANATRTVHVGQASTHNADLNATVQLQMLWVEPGTFTMGSPTTEAGRSADREDEHNVTLTKGFYLGKYEVTQAQYEAVMTGNTDSLSAAPSQYGGNPNRPVEKVSWADTQIFLTRLNAQQSSNIPAGWAYVLPTESQWEYACRAGTTTMYSWGNDINATHANYSVSGLSQTRDVAQYAANPWGFFDMHGNVREWTADWYQAAYPTGNPVVDPTGPASGSSRVRRGGSWNYGGTDLRSSKRGDNTPSDRYNAIGFRVGFQFTGEHSVDLNSSVKLEMLWVEPGTFTMGSPTTEAGRVTNETEHNVTLTKGFYLGKYEVTQAQYEAVMTGNTVSLSATPSEWPNNPNRPVEKVSWADAQIFLTRLNAQQSANIPAGWAYVLPTESQWEYACRAGTTTKYSWGNDTNATRANYNVSGLSQTRDVGYYAANPLGFFDMHGNVWEWTADWYQAAYPTGNPVVDPTGPASGSLRVWRGGSWHHDGTTLRSAKRATTPPGSRSNNIGFRVGFQQQ
jgi:formylglycine-generating enzyme required for sulfatase activity